MVVTISSVAPTCILNMGDDELARLVAGLENKTQMHKNEYDPSINVVYYQSPEQSDKQADQHSAVRNCDESLNNDWKEELMMPYKYYAYVNE